MKIYKIILLLAVLVLAGCSLKCDDEVVYQTKYVKPETKGLQENCSTSTLQKPITNTELTGMRNDEARFIYMSGLYVQSLGAYGKCINETKGVVKYVNEIDTNEESKEHSKPPLK